jgi:ankyrin repeat protein
MCDAGGCTPLSAAAACGHARLVSALIVAGADVNTVDNDGRSVLTVAAAAGHTTVVAALLDEHGMDEFHADNAGLLPVHYAAAHANTTCLRKLVPVHTPHPLTQSN